MAQLHSGHLAEAARNPKGRCPSGPFPIRDSAREDREKGN